MPQKAEAASSTSDKPKRGIITRLIVFLFGFIGFLGRLVAIGILAYGCFASVRFGATESSDSTEPTELIQAGWPLTYSTSEIVNLAAVRSSEPDQPVQPIYDVLYTSEPALAANLAVFGVAVLLLLFTTKLFDRLGNLSMLIVFLVCFAGLGYGIYWRSIYENQRRSELEDSLRQLPGATMQTEQQYVSAMDKIADRIHAVIYRNSADQSAPNREHIYICKLQDLGASETDAICAQPLLKELVLVNCEVTESALLSLAKGCRLRKLVLDGCKISGASIEPLRALPRLKEFEIRESVTIDVPVE